MDQLHKTKRRAKFWCGNKFGNILNKLNCGWMMSQSTEGWWGVNHTSQRTGMRYNQS